MGRLHAEELASGEFVADLDQQLSVHFQSNCYPPVPLIMIDTAIEAINHYNAGWFNELISLPDGITYQGRDSARAYKIIENFHLDAWIDNEVDQIDQHSYSFDHRWRYRCTDRKLISRTLTKESGYLVSQFNLDELGLLHTMVEVSLDNALDNGAPPQIVAVLQSVLPKIESRIEEECNIFNEFQELTTQLDDLHLASKIIVQNPDAVTTDYQN